MKKYLLILILLSIILISGCSQETSDITGKVVDIPIEIETNQPQQSEDITEIKDVAIPNLEITDLECSIDSIDWTHVKGRITNKGIQVVDYVIMDVDLFNGGKLVDTIKAIPDGVVKGYYIYPGESYTFSNLKKVLPTWTRCEAYTQYSDEIIHAIRKTEIGRYEQGEKIINELDSLYEKEKNLLDDMYEDYSGELNINCETSLDRLANMGRFDESSMLIELCYENGLELIDYRSEEVNNLIDLGYSISKDIFNKEQDTDVDLTAYYEELLKEFSKEAKEGRNRFTDKYEILSSTISISETQTQTNTISSSEYECSYNAYNCDAFSRYSEAETVFLYCIGQGKGDVHHLDEDDDGVPCEALWYEENAPSNLNFGLL